MYRSTVSTTKNHLCDDDFEIKSKIYSFNLRLVLKHILHSQDVFFRNLLFTLLFQIVGLSWFLVCMKYLWFWSSLLFVTFISWRCGSHWLLVRLHWLALWVALFVGRLH